MVADARAVLDAAGIERAHVYGVSMGGGIAAELAMQAPERVRSLILGCTMMKTAEKKPPPAALLALYYVPFLLRVMLTGPQARRSYGSAARADKIEVDLAMLAGDSRSARGVAAQGRAVREYVTTREAVARLTMPALVIHGNEDGAVPYAAGREFAEALPNSRFETIEGAGHNYFVADAVRANTLVLDFLNRLDNGTEPSCR
jgi:pimeloyl-ACP methyl ester carboxylesterase